MTDHRRDLVNACADLTPGGNREIQTNYVRAIMDLCERAEPTYIIDIGTNLGASCLAMASGMAIQGKSMEAITTIDIHHGLWMRTQRRWDSWFMNFGVDTRAITALEVDFKALKAEDVIPESGRGMIFWDIHDLEDSTGKPNSPIFISQWLQRITGIVAVHDIIPCEEDWEWPDHWKAPPSFSKIQSIDGQWYRGFGEAETFIEYLNGHNVAPTAIPDTSLIWFEVEGGVPK